MKSSVFAAAVLSALMLFAGCANTSDPATPPTPTTERVYRTGSNIPVKDPTPLTPQAKEKQAEAAPAPLSSTPRPGVSKPGS